MVIDLLPYSSSNSTAHLVNVVCSILTARLVSPHYMGVWSGLRVLQPYPDNFRFGIRHGMNLELPYEIGHGDRIAAEELKNTPLLDLPFYRVWLGAIG